MGNFKDLEVWQLARELVKLVYEATERFPADERFDLTSQIRRAAVSIPSNVAEGAGRQTDGSFGQFVRIAVGSANELETLLTLANDLGILGQPEFDDVVKKLTTVRVKLHNLLSKIRPSVREEMTDYGMSDN